ncbi:MAG TPA: hypothetical protein VHO69_06050 [Phototrophicaceae bacterium]|nr:hypothetical protein [Phototrophicaceae bacterium]
MDTGTLVLLTLTLGLLLLLVQRAEAKRRRVVFILLLPVVGIIIHYANAQQHLWEALIGFILALVLNFFFWLLIGRYNPVGSSDSIKVLGLDD